MPLDPIPTSYQNPDYYEPKLRWRAIYPLALVSIAATLNSSVINVSLPIISEQLHAGIGVVDWVVQAYLLVVTALLMISGRVGDLFGRRRTYQAGIVIFTIGSALCGFADSITALIAARIFQGVGAALTVAIGPALIGEIFPPDSRGKALGILGTTVAVGLSVGPVLGGIITDFLGWRYIFFLNIPFGILAALLVNRYLQRDKETVRSPFDVSGSFTMALSLFCILLLLSRGNEWGWLTMPILALAAGSILFPILFLTIERNTSAPVLDLKLFRNPTFSSATSAGFLIFTAHFTQTFLLPFYLIQLRGFPPAEAGLFLMAVPSIMAIIAPASGALSDKIGTKELCMGGLLLHGIGFVMLTFLNESTSSIYIIASLSLLGLGIGMFNPPNNAEILGSVPRDRLGNASGMLGLTRTMGMAFGIALSSVIFTGARNYLLASSGLSGASLPETQFAFLGGLHWAMLAAAAISWAGMGAVLIREKKNSRV